MKRTPGPRSWTRLALLALGAFACRRDEEAYVCVTPVGLDAGAAGGAGGHPDARLASGGAPADVSADRDGAADLGGDLGGPERPRDAGVSDAGKPVFAACTRPPCLNVYNNCSIPLWTHAVATVAIDEGNVRKLEPGQQWQYAALPQLGGGRLYAYYKEPASKQDRVRLVSDYNQFVEMTLDTDPVSGGVAQNYNVSYVDYVSLPVSMKAAGATCAETRCGGGFDAWAAALARCPTELRNPSGKLATCMGSYNFCITPDGAATFDVTHPYCSKMRDAHGFAGSAIYGGYFPDHPAQEVPFWDGVAAWNRGTVAGDADEAHYYKTEPYNHYAKWIHEELGCANVYAFSTDDHQDKAGFVRCVSPELDVVWCP
jgi:hypothetical protein